MGNGVVANQPHKSTEVRFARGEAGLCKLAFCKEDISTGFVGKVEKRTYSRAEWEAFLVLFDNVFVMIGDRLIVFTEGVIRLEWCFMFRDFGVGIVMLHSVEKVQCWSRM
jgi:hypothetical protein